MSSNWRPSDLSALVSEDLLLSMVSYCLIFRLSFSSYIRSDEFFSRICLMLFSLAAAVAAA